MGCGYEDDKAEFLISTFELDSVSHMFVQESHTLAMFYAHALRDGRGHAYALT